MLCVFRGRWEVFVPNWISGTSAIKFVSVAEYAMHRFGLRCALEGVLCLTLGCAAVEAIALRICVSLRQDGWHGCVRAAV